MCDVMPTISEDSISQRSSQFSGEDANFEQLMVSMLDERDKLMDSLRETQERLQETEVKLTDVEKERDSLQRQIAANLPQVSAQTYCAYACRVPVGDGEAGTHDFELYRFYKVSGNAIFNACFDFLFQILFNFTLNKLFLIKHILENRPSLPNDSRLQSPRHKLSL